MAAAVGGLLHVGEMGCAEGRGGALVFVVVCRWVERWMEVG